MVADSHRGKASSATKRSSSRSKTAASSSSSSSSGKLNLNQARTKILDPGLGYDEMSLRIPFLHPENIGCEDIFVETMCSMERGRGNPHRKEVSNKVRKHAFQTLTKHFSASSKDSAKLILHIYVCDASLGDPETRMCSVDTTIHGAVRLCLGWSLSFNRKNPDAQLVLDGGRLVGMDGLMGGVWDYLDIHAGESCLYNSLVPKLCQRIIERLQIGSNRTLFERMFGINNPAPPEMEEGVEIREDDDEGVTDDDEEGTDDDEDESFESRGP